MKLMLIFFYFFTNLFSHGFCYPWLFKLLPSENQDIFKGFLFLRFQTVNSAVSEEQLLEVELIPGKLFSKQLELSFYNTKNVRISMFLADASCGDENHMDFQYIRFSSGHAGVTIDGKVTGLSTVHFNSSCANYLNFERNFVVLKNLSLSVSPECFFENVFRENGSTFGFGCRQNCSCIKGVIECLPTCEEVSLGTHCRRVNVLGTCCPGSECEDDATKKTVRCQDPVLPVEYPYSIAPWAYYVVVDRYSSDNAAWCGATLISEKWLLMSAHCIVSPKNGQISPQYLEIYRPYKTGNLQFIGEMSSDKIDRVEIHPQYNRSEIYSSKDFALLKLSSSSTPMKFRQNLNMPRLNRCNNYFSGSDCKPAVTVYSNTSTSLEFKQVTLNPLSKNTLGCKNEKDIFCFQQDQINVSKFFGDSSGVFAKTNKHYDIIGLVIEEKDTQSNSNSNSKNEKTIRVLSICDVRNWIRETIGS